MYPSRAWFPGQPDSACHLGRHATDGRGPSSSLVAVGERAESQRRPRPALSAPGPPLLGTPATSPGNSRLAGTGIKPQPRTTSQAYR